MMYQFSRCSPKVVDTRRCATKDAGPKGGGFGEVPHQLEKGTSASKDARPQRAVDCDVLHWLEMRTKHYL